MGYEFETLTSLNSLNTDRLSESVRHEAYLERVFDFENIKDNATYTDPHRYPTGIDHVMINGKFAIKDGALTGERPGEWLKGPFLRK